MPGCTVAGMPRSIFVPLGPDLFEALLRVAHQDMRDPRREAARLIEDAIKRRDRAEARAAERRALAGR